MTAGTREADIASRELADLVHHWGSAFTISVSGSQWAARARNRATGRPARRGATLRSDSAAGLRHLIRAEYARLTRIRPVR